MNPRVFIVQEPTTRGPDGSLVPLMDFRKVLEYGDPVVCLPPGKVALSPAPTIDLLREKLKGFSDSDYLVAVGDPSAIAIASSVACELNRGKFNMLKWDKSSKRYILVSVDIHYRTRKD